MRSATGRGFFSTAPAHPGNTATMGKFEAGLLVLAIIGPIVALLVAFVLWAGRQQRKRREETLRRIGESLGVSATSPATSALAAPGQATPSLEATVDGLRYRVFPFVRGRYEYVEIQLQTEANLPLVVFRPETGRDRVGRALFLNRELQLGDPTFDAAVYIESDESDEHIRAALADERMRQAVLETVRAGRTVTLSKHGVSMVLPISFATPAKPQIEQQLGFLRQLATGVRNVDGALGTAQRARGDLLALASWIGFGVIYLLAFVASIVNPATWEPLHPVGQGLPKQLALVTVLVLVVFTFVWVRGHSRSLRNFLLTLFPGAFWLPFLPSLVLWGGNALFDQTPLSTVRATVLSKSERRNGRSTTYRIKFAVDSQQTPPQYMTYKTLSLNVRRSEFKALAVGDEAAITVHGGAFGWPWIGPIAPDRPPAATP